MEFRKHYSTFSAKEMRLINERLKANTYKVSNHTTIRQREKIITTDEIYRAIDNGKVIEIHIKGNDVRALIRGNIAEQNKYNICVVISLTTGDIITAYDNVQSDKHYTLDTTKYISYIDITGILKNTYIN